MIYIRQALGPTLYGPWILNKLSKPLGLLWTWICINTLQHFLSNTEWEIQL
jgi:hypothetical protein